MLLLSPPRFASSNGAAARGRLAKPPRRLVEIYPFVYITISSIFSAPSKTTSHSPSWLFSIRPPPASPPPAAPPPLCLSTSTFPFPNRHSGYFKRNWIHVLGFFPPYSLPPHTHQVFPQSFKTRWKKKIDELNLMWL